MIDISWFFFPEFFKNISHKPLGWAKEMYQYVETAETYGGGSTFSPRNSKIIKSSMGLARCDRVWRTWGLYLPAFFAASIVCSQLATLTSVFLLVVVQWSGVSPQKKTSCPLICFLGQVCPMMSWASFENLRCLDIQGLLGRSWWLCCFTIWGSNFFPLGMLKSLHILTLEMFMMLDGKKGELRCRVAHVQAFHWQENTELND